MIQKNEKLIKPRAEIFRNGFILRLLNRKIVVIEIPSNPQLFDVIFYRVIPKNTDKQHFLNNAFKHIKARLIYKSIVLSKEALESLLEAYPVYLKYKNYVRQ